MHGDRSIRGFSLAEMLVVLALIGLVLAVSLANLRGITNRSSLQAAAQEISSELRKARGRSIATGRNVAIRFRMVDTVWHYGFFEDGDFDGVLNADIAKGIDYLIQPERPVLKAGGRARIGLPTGTPLRDPDSGQAISPNASPVRFGNSSLCSFSPRGSGTPGSVYLTDGSGAAIVRVTGGTGRVRILIWDPGSKKWRKR